MSALPRSYTRTISQHRFNENTGAHVRQTMDESFPICINNQMNELLDEQIYERRLACEWDRELMELSATGRWLHHDAVALIIRQLIYSDRMIHSLCKYMRSIQGETQ